MDPRAPDDSAKVTLSLGSAGASFFAQELKLSPAFTARYEIQRELGRGGCGAVFSALDKKLGRTVAIKLMFRPERTEDATRFLQEARLLSTINHPAVITLHDFDDESGHPYLVLELVTGGSLRDAIKRGPLAVPEALALASDVLAGLAACHAAGVIHRDIKPENILMTGEGRPKISDLGVALFHGAVARLTRTGALVGSPRYMAPEQIRGDEVDCTVDLHAMATVIYEMIAGVAAYPDDHLPDLVRKLVGPMVPDLGAIVPGVDSGVIAFLKKGMAKKPADRFSTAIEMLVELEALYVRAPRLRKTALMARPAEARATPAPGPAATTLEGDEEVVGLAEQAIQQAPAFQTPGSPAVRPRPSREVTRPARALATPVAGVAVTDAGGARDRVRVGALAAGVLLAVLALAGSRLGQRGMPATVVPPVASASFSATPADVAADAGEKLNEVLLNEVGGIADHFNNWRIAYDDMDGSFVAQNPWQTTVKACQAAHKVIAAERPMLDKLRERLRHAYEKGPQLPREAIVSCRLSGLDFVTGVLLHRVHRIETVVAGDPGSYLEVAAQVDQHPYSPQIVVRFREYCASFPKAVDAALGGGLMGRRQVAALLTSLFQVCDTFRRTGQGNYARDIAAAREALAAKLRERGPERLTNLVLQLATNTILFTEHGTSSPKTLASAKQTRAEAGELVRALPECGGELQTVIKLVTRGLP